MPGASHSELMPGSVLGKYRIERLLGHGGMATVYLAVQETSGLEVALKVLTFRGESNRPGGDVARFIREARLAGAIRNPHWVSVYETGYDAKNNLYYIAMERMQASLAQRLRAHGPLPEAEAIAVVEQVALALDKAF
ncbi:MAG: protein kinase [Kiritimatiellae bacterium]|nr:protein kinase [Kiritimatiellia bacterium]